MKYFLGIDLGTSAVKAILFNTEFQVMAEKSHEYPVFHPFGGAAEQNPEDWWKGVITTVRALSSKAKADGAEIVSVGLTGQMHGVVLLNGDGNELTNSLIWCDQRSSGEVAEIEKICGRKRYIEITANAPTTGFSLPKIMWLMKNKPEIYAECRHILLPKDYIRYKLTGLFASEYSDASGTGLLDVPGRKWSAELCSLFKVNSDYLPELYESTAIAGRIDMEASALTGLPQGVPVAGGAGDQAAAGVGNGIIREGLLSFSLGTSGVIFAYSDAPLIDKAGRLHTFCHAVPGRYHIMGVTQGFGLSIKWFRDNFCSREAISAKARGMDVYALLDGEAAKLPIGSNKLIYLPYLMGERSPHNDPDIRGAFLGLSANHGVYDMYRAVLEGVVYSLKDCAEVMKEMGIECSSASAGGGGAKSPILLQMLSDVLGIGINTYANADAGCLGAAMLAAVASGVYKDLEAASEIAVRIKNEYSSDPNRKEEYGKYFTIYRKFYKAIAATGRELTKA